MSPLVGYDYRVRLWITLRRLWSKRKARRGGPHSIVLLLRKYHFFSSSEIEAAGKAGWGVTFDGVEDPMYFVVQSGGITLLKAGKHAVNVLQADSTYLGNSSDIVSRLPHEGQQIAWKAHTAWASVDIIDPHSEIKKVDVYATLARLALFLGDENCCGIYLPAEGIMMPNDGTAEEGLRSLIRKEAFR
ncbi:MAG TPA: hypothetical protein VGR47_02135 [Terracidiphilus sp.]|nr:hypothetical protein [Terracidiphilus sp.]